ncbi:metallophosphoesterase family protein [Desulfolithobacter sp.]
MFTFLHCADIHLDSPLRNLTLREQDGSVIRTAVRRAFDDLVQLALDQQVAFVLIGGDLYDGAWKDYHTGLYFINHMQRLGRSGIRVFLVSGNHDAASRITTALRLPDNVVLYATSRAETVVLEETGVAVHGRGYGRRAVTDNLALSYPEPVAGMFNIGLLHTGLSGRPGHEPYAPCSVEDLVSRGYDYWALGHVHQREVVHQDPWIVFPGNIQGRHIREDGPRGATLVTVENGKVTAVEHHDLDHVRWSRCRVDLTACISLDKVLEQIEARLAETVDLAEGRAVAVRVDLHGETPCHPELHRNREHLFSEILALAMDLGDVWLEKVRLETSFPARDTTVTDPGLVDLDRLLKDIESPLELAPELEKFLSRLPAELGGRESLLPDDPTQSHELLCTARDLLLGRILGHLETR